MNDTDLGNLPTDALVATALKEALATLAAVCELANGLAVRVASLEERVNIMEGDIVGLTIVDDDS